MERCSSTTSTRPQVRKTSLHPPKRLLLFPDKDNASGFALCLQFRAGPVAQPRRWRVMLDVGSRAAPQARCPPAPPAGMHGLAALHPRCLPAREAETGRLHTGLLFSLSFCLLFGALGTQRIYLNAFAPSRLVCLLKLIQDSSGS